MADNTAEALRKHSELGSAARKELERQEEAARMSRMTPDELSAYKARKSREEHEANMKDINRGFFSKLLDSMMRQPSSAPSIPGVSGKKTDSSEERPTRSPTPSSSGPRG